MQINSSTSQLCYKHIHTHTHHFNSHFSTLVWFSSNASSPFILHLFQSCASSWDKIFSYPGQHHPTMSFLGVPWSHLSNSIYSHRCTTFNQISIIFTFHLNLPFLIIKITGSKPNNSLSSAIFFLSTLLQATSYYKIGRLMLKKTNYLYWQLLLLFAWI